MRSEDLAAVRRVLAPPGHPEKRWVRLMEFSQHPKRQIIINTASLKSIIQYDEFLCYPHCSVDRHQARHGSDINDGLVVTSASVGLEQQRGFIAELERQGFVARTEADGAVQRTQVLLFRTPAQLRNDYALYGVRERAVQIYLAGYVIERRVSACGVIAGGQPADAVDGQPRHRSSGHRQADAGIGGQIAETRAVCDWASRTRMAKQGGRTSLPQALAGWVDPAAGHARFV